MKTGEGGQRKQAVFFSKNKGTVIKTRFCVCGEGGGGDVWVACQEREISGKR
jgi:hypothetical protein